MVSKEELREKFIVEEEFKKDQLLDYIEDILDYCKVLKDGEVYIEKNNLTNMDKAGLTVIARYLASQLDEDISEEVSIDTIVESTNIERDQASARAADLVRKNYIKRIERGMYKAIPPSIPRFIKKRLRD